jgi:hypothetical protein
MTAARDEAMIITVLRAQSRTGKSYSLRDGVLEKTSVATAKGRAVGLTVDTARDHAELLREITGELRSVLIPGYFSGSDVNEPFDIVYEAELRELLGPAGKGEVDGVWEIKGRPAPVAARLKKSIEPCAWQLLDFDTPEGMPPEFAGLDIAGRLALLEKVVPGISACERIECRSSTARIVKPGGVPGRASHAWVRLGDPTLTETLRLHIQVEAALHSLSFLSPRHSTTTGEIIGQARLTLLDLAVLIRGRIVFCSAPTISDAMAKAGWTVADAGVTIVNAGAGALDISGIAKPSAERLEAYRLKTGEHLKIGGQKASFSVTSCGALDLDTPVETTHAPVASFGEAVKWLQGQPKGTHLRCQTPFRDSVSEAAFICIDRGGQPYLYDSGTTTTYRLAAALPRELPDMRAVGSKLAAAVEGGMKDALAPAGSEDAMRWPW